MWVKIHPRKQAYSQGFTAIPDIISTAYLHVPICHAPTTDLFILKQNSDQSMVPAIYCIIHTALAHIGKVTNIIVHVCSLLVYVAVGIISALQGKCIGVTNSTRKLILTLQIIPTVD